MQHQAYAQHPSNTQHQAYAQHPFNTQHQAFTPVQASSENVPSAYVHQQAAAPLSPYNAYGLGPVPEARPSNVHYHISAFNVQVGSGSTIVSHEGHPHTFEEDEADALDRRFNPSQTLYPDVPAPVKSPPQPQPQPQPQPAAREDDDFRSQTFESHRSWSKPTVNDLVGQVRSHVG